MNKDVSRFLSLVLRHKPEVIGITLDRAGWVDVEVLLEQLAKHNKVVTRAELERIVEEDDKKRYVLSEDGRRIKAAQGHSVDVELELKSETPPLTLYHGTVERFLPEIRKDGLRKMSRHHVHLSKDAETATSVGARRGEAIILQVAAKHMHNEGYKFFLTENGVWLTDHVPPQYIAFP